MLDNNISRWYSALIANVTEDAKYAYFSSKHNKSMFNFVII